MAEYIDKQSIVSIMQGLSNMVIGKEGEIYAHVARMVELMIPDEVVPVVHGRWIWFHEIVKDMHGLRAIDGCRCSLCGMGSSGRAFCENCGAKMDEEDNDG